MSTTLILEKGCVLKINGIPVKLKTDAEIGVESNNLPFLFDLHSRTTAEDPVFFLRPKLAKNESFSPKNSTDTDNNG